MPGHNGPLIFNLKFLRKNFVMLSMNLVPQTQEASEATSLCGAKGTQWNLVGEGLAREELPPQGL